MRSGLGVAVLPTLAVTGVDGDDELRVHPLEPSPSREIHLHWPSVRTLSPLARRAIELSREIAATVQV